MKQQEYFNANHLMDNIKKRAVRGAGVTVISRIAIYCIQIVGTMVLARILVPGDFGLVAMVTVLTNILVEFGTLRLSDATVQKDEINHRQISTLFWINFALCAGLTVVLMVASPLIAWFYKEPRLQSVTIVIAFTFVFSGLSIQHLALLQRNMEFHKIAFSQIIAIVVTDIIAIAMAWKGLGYWALVARRLGYPMGAAAGAWVLCRWRPGLPARDSEVRPMLKFGINSLGNYSMNYFSRSMDKVLIGWRYGSQLLGFYDRAYYLFVLPVNQLSYPLTSVAVATLSRLRDDPERYQRYYLNAISMIAFIGMPLSAILTLIGKDFILLLLGPQWGMAGQIFSVFGPGIGVMLIYGTDGWLHLSLGRADRWFRWGIVAAIATTISFIIGLQFGPIGVAIAYAASFYILIGPCLWYAGRPINLKFSSIVLAIWKSFISALGAGVISWFITNSVESTSNVFAGFNIFVRIVVSCAVCIVLYLILIILLYQSTKPILQFISVLSEMAPVSSLKNLRLKRTGY